MGFIETLSKYCKKIPFEQTKLYFSIEEEKDKLEENGFRVKLKDDFDMFNLEIYLKGFENKNQIDRAYTSFLNQNYDILEFLNYEEKRNMFNADIEEMLTNMTSFYDEKSKTQIYIPFLEPFVNEWYSHNYAIMMLKQHHDYVKNYQSHIHSAIDLYGNGIYRTDFSSLQVVYEDQRHVCLYFPDLYTIYIFKKENMDFINEVTFVDHHFKGVVDNDDVKTIASYIEEYHYQECLDFLSEKNYIDSKIYKKIEKKYK